MFKASNLNAPVVPRTITDHKPYGGARGKPCLIDLRLVTILPFYTVKQTIINSVSKNIILLKSHSFYCQEIGV